MNKEDRELMHKILDEIIDDETGNNGILQLASINDDCSITYKTYRIHISVEEETRY